MAVRGRPKKKAADRKSLTKSVRMKLSDFKEIKSVYGSVQAFFTAALIAHYTQTNPQEGDRHDKSKPMGC